MFRPPYQTSGTACVNAVLKYHSLFLPTELPEILRFVGTGLCIFTFTFIFISSLPCLHTV